MSALKTGVSKTPERYQRDKKNEKKNKAADMQPANFLRILPNPLAYGVY